MTRTNIDSLTPKERQCLRLVAPDRKSALIAAELGISISTVETHLLSARRKLGGLGRFAAARLLEEHEGRQSSTSHRSTMGGSVGPAVADPPYPTFAPGSEPLSLSDAHAVFDASAAPSGRSSHVAPRNELSRLNRVAIVAFSVMALAIAGIAAIPLSDAVQRVARMIMTQRN